MATRRAVANGNWSATATWNGGVVPTNGDTVYANGFNITLDTDVLIGGANNPTVSAGSFVSGQWYEIDFVGTTSWTGIGAASNTTGTVFLATGVGSGTGTAKATATLTTTNNTAAGAAANGSFVMSTIRAMTCDLRAGTTQCLNITATSGTLNLSGIRSLPGVSAGAHGINNNSTAAVDISACNFTGGGAAVAAFAFNNASTGAISISNSTFTGGNTTNTTAFNNASTAVVTVSASIFAGGSGSSNTFGINNASTGSITCTGCTFSGGGGATSSGINNASTGSITIAGSTFTAGVGPACNNTSTGTLIIATSTFAASSTSNAISIANNSADVRLSGDFLDHWSGFKAVNGGKWRLGITPAAARTRYALAGTTDSYIEMFTADNTGFGLPAANHVRSGISYGGGAVSGTCAVPAAGSVALGVPVDNTSGTAVLTPEAVWGHASRTITGGTVDTLTNAPASVTPNDIWGYATRTLTTSSGPTAVEIRQEIDANSTKLDAAVSSRLASASYTAPTTPPTAAEIATAVEGSLLNEADGQAVLNAIVGAIGNTNLSEVSLVAAIRSDIERSGGKLDAVPTAAANASAVWGTATKTITGGTVDTLTNSPSVPSAASIAAATRSELAVELARVDQNISSRLASADYSAPSAAPTAAQIRSEIDANSTQLSGIKSKTDALNTERLANVATTAIVGNLIAQANS